jgi:two-component system, chemotaxis family, sensor kinase CheA
LNAQSGGWRVPMSEFEAYRGLFVAESRENHENMVKNLLILETGTDVNAIDEIFRSIHTLKGASASMGFATMEHLCHTMEDVFQLIRSGSAEISPELGNLLLACSDLIEQMLDDVEAGGDSSSKNPDEVIQGLRTWLEKLGAGHPKPEKGAVPKHNVKAASEISSEISEGTTPEYQIRIIVSPECMMKDVRALLAIGNLESLGTIISSTPSKEAIDEGNFEDTVDLRIASEAGEEALRTAASGTEIASVEITPIVKNPPESSEPGSLPAKMADGDRKQSPAQDKSREIKNLRVDIHQLDHIMNLV